MFRSALERIPDRREFGLRSGSLRFQPLGLEPGSSEKFRLVGAWQLSADDPRFGGLSALAIEDDHFISITDSGVVSKFSKPTNAVARVTLDELPDGPGAAGFKMNRDSEAIVGDPLHRGWWIAFENRDSVWLYDRAFSKVLIRQPLTGLGLKRNRGIEGMVAVGQDLLLFSEGGREAFRLNKRTSIPVTGLSGWLGDVARLPDGRLLAVNRKLTPVGLSNALVVLNRHGEGYLAGSQWRIPVGRLDNVEGLSAELMPDGSTRLWMVTDNNFQQRRPTLLIAVDLKPPLSRRR